MASRRIITHLIKKTVIGTLIGVAIFGSLMIIPVGHAAAKMVSNGGSSTNPTLFDSKTVEQQAQIWSSIQAATNSQSQCFVTPYDPNPGVGNPTGISGASIRAGNWFTSDRDVSIGHHVSPSIGTVNCGNENNWLKNLLDNAGFANQFAAQSTTVFANPNVTGDTQTGAFGNNPGTARTNLTKLLATAFFGTPTIPAIPPQVEGQILLDNFLATQACGAKVIPTGIAPDQLAALHDVQGRTFVTLPTYVAGQSTPGSSVYYYDDATAAISVGYGLSLGAATDGQLQCSTIANALKNPKYINALIAYSAANPTANPGVGAGAGAGADVSINCGSKLAVILNPLNWLMCPIAEGLAGVAKSLDSGINDMMTIDTGRIFAGDSGYHTAWAAMRNYALIFLVIATLIIIISQALGFEILDAYTVRKVLPRLLIAAVAMSLSWQLMSFFVTLTNDLGAGIRGIIYAPFSSLQPSGGVTLGGQGFLLTELLGAGAIWALGVFGMLSFLATAALAVAVAFLVLVLRNILIIMLIIFAPIAIVCYILPNTKKVYDIWLDSFAKGLMMFPIIAAFIAVGRVGAVVASRQGGGLNSFVAFVSYFAPYFLLPLTFKFAGGAIGAIGGAVHNSTGGMRRGLSKYRSDSARRRMANGKERIKSGNALRGEDAVSRGISRGLENASLIGAGGMTLSARKRRARMRTERATRQQTNASKAMQENEGFGSFSKDDEKLKAGVNGKDEAGVRAELAKSGRFSDPVVMNDAVAEIMAAKKTMGRDVFNKAATRSLAPTGTAFESSGDMLRFINNAYGSDRSGAGKALGEMRDGALKSGRVDVGGASYGEMAKQMDAMYGGTKQEVATASIMNNVRKSNGGATAAYGKPKSARAVAQAHADNIDKHIQSMNSGVAVLQDDDTTRVSTARDIKQSIASAHGVHDAIRGASPDNAREFADVLMNHQLDPGSMNDATRAALGAQASRPGGTNLANTGPSKEGPVTVRQVMDDLGGHDQAYLEMRTDYAIGGAGAITEDQAKLRAVQPGLTGEPNAAPHI